MPASGNINPFSYFFWAQSDGGREGGRGGKGNGRTYITLPIVAVYRGRFLVFGACAVGVVVDRGGGGEGGAGEEGHGG